MEIHFVGRNHDKKVIFEESISVRQALNIADIQPSTVIVSFEENIIPHSTLIKSDIKLNVITISSGG